MTHLLKCRRTLVAVFSITCLTALGVYKGIDTSMAIATIAAALSGSNAYEKRGDKTPKRPKYLANDG